MHKLKLNIMEKKTTIKIQASDLTEYLKEKGHIKDNELISKIYLITETTGIIVEIESYSDIQKKFLEMPISEMDVSVRLTFIFRSNNIKTGADIYKKVKKQNWRELKNIGKKSFAEIESLLNSNNLAMMEK